MGYPEAIKVLVAHMADPATKLSTSEKREVKRIDECLYAGSVHGYAPLKDMTQLLKSYSRVERHSRTDRAHVVAAFNKLYPGRPAGLLDILADVAACVAGFGEGKEGLLTFDFNEAGDFASFYNDMKFVYALPEQTVPDTTAATGVLAKILETLSTIDKRLVSLENKMSEPKIPTLEEANAISRLQTAHWYAGLSSSQSEAVDSNVEEVQERTGVIIKHPEAQDDATLALLRGKTYDKLLDIVDNASGYAAYRVLRLASTLERECVSNLHKAIPEFPLESVYSIVRHLEDRGYMVKDSTSVAGTLGKRVTAYTITTLGSAELKKLHILHNMPSSPLKRFVLTPLLAAQVCAEFSRGLKASTCARRLFSVMLPTILHHGNICVTDLILAFNGEITSEHASALLSSAKNSCGYLMSDSGPLKGKQVTYKFTDAGQKKSLEIMGILSRHLGCNVRDLSEHLIGDMRALVPDKTSKQQCTAPSGRNSLYLRVLNHLYKTRSWHTIDEITCSMEPKALQSSITSCLHRLVVERAVARQRVPAEKRPKGINLLTEHSITSLGIRVLEYLRTGIMLGNAIDICKKNKRADKHDI